MPMKQFFVSVFLSGLLCLPVSAAPLSSNAQTVIPSAVQQIRLANGAGAA
jgi:hypothetical protein